MPLYLGIKAILVKSFARIHKDNLINSGILPLVLIDKNDYERFDEYDEIEMNDVIQSLKTEMVVKVFNKTKNFEILCRLEGSETDVEVLIAGGYLNYMELIRKAGIPNV